MGNQGGSLPGKLIQLGWIVHATARDLEVPRVAVLEALGAKLAQG
jgi:hypothetical protein